MTRETLPARALAAWAADDPFPPYAHYPDFAPERRLAYRAEQLGRLGADPAHHAFLVAGDGGSVAFGVTRLAWDTEQLGLAAGRVDYALARLDPPEADSERRRTRTAALLRAAAPSVAETADALGIRHLSARFDARDFAATQAFEAHGFELVDALIRFSVDAAGSPAPDDTVVLRDARPDDIPALRALAGRAFVYDRLHNDPAVPRVAADRLHAAWVENAVHGRAGSGVLVAEADGGLAGFFVLALDHAAARHFGSAIGTLVLVAVDDRVRRRGIARALSLGGVAWLGARGAARVEVGTQLANIPATSLYLKAGFRPAQASVSLRRYVP